MAVYESGDAGGVDPGAIAGGLLAGLAALAGLGLALGLVIWQVPMTARGLTLAGLTVQALAAVGAGGRAGRRAPGSGLLHGVLAGLALAALLAAVQAIGWNMPGWLALVQRGGLLAAAGALGGIAGINMGR